MNTTTPWAAGDPQPSTPETRGRFGCYAPISGGGCWCGYAIHDGYGCCRQCVMAMRKEQRS